MSLLATESKLLVLLLALGVGSVTTCTATLAALGLLGVLDGNVEQVIGVVGRSRRVSLALCIECQSPGSHHH